MSLQKMSYPVIGLMLCFVVTGCSREKNQQQPVTTATGSKTSTAPASAASANEQSAALVRVINAVPDKRALDIAAKDTDAFQDVSYKTVTPYREIPSDAGKFTVKPAGEATAQPLAENSESLASGRHYTVVAFPDKDQPNKVYVKAINDDQEPSTSGRARIRIINASPDVDKIAVFVRGEKDPLFSGIDFREAASYKEVGPGETTLELRRDEGGLTKHVPDATTANRGGKATATRNDTDGILATQPVNLEAGKTYTIVLAGHSLTVKGEREHERSRTAESKAAANEHHNGLDVIVVEDTVPQQQPARTE